MALVRSCYGVGPVVARYLSRVYSQNETAEKQRGHAAMKAKTALTQRRRETRRSAEQKKPLRNSASLCASALNLRSLRANQDIGAAPIWRRKERGGGCPIRLP